jgi:hypothetical protein
LLFILQSLSFKIRDFLYPFVCIMHAMYVRKRYGVCGLRAFRRWFGGKSLGIESCSRENQDLFSRLISKKMSRGRERKQGRRERRSKEVSECSRD